MRKLILAAALGAVGLTAVPAEAQRYGNYGHSNRGYGYNDNRQDCRRAMRRADNRWEYRRAREICQRARYSHGDRGYGDHRRYDDHRRGHDDHRRY